MTAQESLLAALRARAEKGRAVAFKCDFYALPQAAQDALYGIAGELEEAADEMERLLGERQLGPQTQSCPDPSCSVMTVGMGYTTCPRCDGELVSNV